MRSLKHQILLLMLGSLVVLATSLVFVLGWHLKHGAVDAAIVKAKTDLATCMDIIEYSTPGPWHVKDGMLFKGEIQISYSTELVDHLAELTGDTVTLFLGDTRVATTVRSVNGERAVGTKVSDIVAQTVLKDGQIYLGEANVVGQLYQTAYEPIRDSNGDIVGIFYVGISRSYTQAFIVNSLIRVASFGLGLTVIVVLLTWFFIQRVVIRPIHEITLGTRDVATGHLTEKVAVSGPKEIGELAVAFNQMVERLGDIADEMSKVSMKKDSQVEKITLVTNHTEEPEIILDETHKQNFYIDQQGLPKGLNQLTLKQIVSFLSETKDPVSAENVAEGVNLTRVTVRRYLDFLEQYGALTTDLKYGTVGRPVKLYHPELNLSLKDIEKIH
ncbi:cache domain-containing protein [Desulfosporosinus nitroreducens]|uniref:Cache domain-containing protein n=1 Tax=Desulfosporosinus nitroreducens TaxID=2018668 RepID=A0ABT8QQ81_9FIRM|nr:cache domain-containing protein [Desulfosporosinus nitroreducens]MCO1603973.1 cache domain-containing protein [Desulfosporosinus nitroreducens]MDO0822795.1 cache domain-containing protein [Desulfosporosinus nitroreducens]